MNKNMYALMLSENVVAAIDRLAYEAGTNRSQMVNSILAEYVSFRTPEMRLREMFEMMESLLSPAEGFKVMLRSSDTLFNLRSALAYKYNPTIHYSVELYRMISDTVGELRVSLRTQNSRLKLYIMQFYKLWSKLESSFPGGSEYAVEGEKFMKKLILRSGGMHREEIPEDKLSEAIVQYICAFDSALKAFFYSLDDADEAIDRVRRIYRDYRVKADILF
jgi:hypothetical protein